MSLQTLLHRQSLRLLTMWPHDRLRPGLSLPESLRLRMESYFRRAAESDSTLPSQSGSHVSKDNGGQERAVIKFEPKKVQKEMNILASLLEDRYKQKYTLSPAVLKPQGNPEYYERLMKEIDEAPGRGIVGRLVNRWKGWIRMK